MATYMSKIKKKLKFHWQPRWLTRDGGASKGYWLWSRKPVLSGRMWVYPSNCSGMRGLQLIASLKWIIRHGIGHSLKPGDIIKLY